MALPGKRERASSRLIGEEAGMMDILGIDGSCLSGCICALCSSELVCPVYIQGNADSMRTLIGSLYDSLQYCLSFLPLFSVPRRAPMIASGSESAFEE